MASNNRMQIIKAWLESLGIVVNDNIAQLTGEKAETLLLRLARRVDSNVIVKREGAAAAASAAVAAVAASGSAVSAVGNTLGAPAAISTLAIAVPMELSNLSVVIPPPSVASTAASTATTSGQPPTPTPSVKSEDDETPDEEVDDDTAAPDATP